MTRLKKIEQEKEIETLIYLYIEMCEGTFNEKINGHWAFWEIASSLKCSFHKVKRIFYKKIKTKLDN